MTTVIRNLAAILQKAQHRIDAETKQPIDVGRQVQYIKHEFVRLQGKIDRLQAALTEVRPLVESANFSRERYPKYHATKEEKR